MESNPEVALRRRFLPLAAVAVAWFGLAAPALADTLPPGGSISTGSTVSPSDPIQMTVTAPAGGTFTLTKVSSPSSRAQFSFFSDGVFVGPQFRLTYSAPAGCGPNQPSNAYCGPQASQEYQQESNQKLDVSFLIDKSIMPRSGDAAAKYPFRYAAAWVCVTNQAGSPPHPNSSCDSAGMAGSPDVTGQDLPDGNAVLHDPVDNAVLLLAGGDSATFDIGHQNWHVTASKRLRGSDLQRGVRVGIQCRLACTQAITVSVSQAVARKLHLPSTQIGHKLGSADVDWRNFYVPVSSAFRHAMQRYHRVSVTVHATVTGDQGERWTGSWQQELTGGFRAVIARQVQSTEGPAGFSASAGGQQPLIDPVVGQSDAHRNVGGRPAPPPAYDWRC